MALILGKSIVQASGPSRMCKSGHAGQDTQVRTRRSGHASQDTQVRRYSSGAPSRFTQSHTLSHDTHITVWNTLWHGNATWGRGHWRSEAAHKLSY
jgi:hypothetical protein